MPNTVVTPEKKEQLSNGCRDRAEAWADTHSDWAAQMDLLGDHVGAAITHDHLESALRDYFAMVPDVATWQGVLYVGKQTALPKVAWGKFVDEVAQIVSVGDDPMTYVGNLTPVNVGTTEAPVWRSSEYMVLANFDRSIINPKVIKEWLVSIFQANPSAITYELDSFTVDARPTAYADYSYNDTFMLRIAFFGLESQNTTCTRAESRAEAEAWIEQHPTLWEPLE